MSTFVLITEFNNVFLPAIYDFWICLELELGSVGGQTDFSIDYDLSCVISSGTFKCAQSDAYGNWGCRGHSECSK
ncbi:AKH_1a_G0000880.mRNA.1.CDS.1 [Saccharomyces cerevisiae]|nr:CBK_G0000840.mRNA.1.CDS.1 [Saccharomyces cerevisiae]CAI4245831.1 AKH_1a_G0000880.mRNA.1.CDS.1 [Saccharomyces cerevisiae]CAI6473723.1 AKH_1a_G0000880.mRNA.1.CDS.1 [Saccharomyces cerevisiae]CAI7130353.1 CBK_G0000840.mRNA.1.CDS.1 [Saccharomyces cerevisiae]